MGYMTRACRAVDSVDGKLHVRKPVAVASLHLTCWAIEWLEVSQKLAIDQNLCNDPNQGDEVTDLGAEAGETKMNLTYA